MGQSRQAYYQGSPTAARFAKAQLVQELVCEQRMRQPRPGTHKLHYLLQEPLQLWATANGR